MNSATMALPIMATMVATAGALATVKWITFCQW